MVGVSEELVVIDLADKGDAVGVAASHRAKYAKG